MAEIDNLPQNTLAAQATFLVILRRFFGEAISRQLPKWAYHEDPLQTKLIIEMGYNVNLEQLGKKPAISVQRGTFTTQRSSFGDKAAPTMSVEGEALYSKQIFGTISFNVYSTQGGEAEAIANLIFELFVTQEQLLEREFKFKWLGEVSVGSPSIVEEHKSMYVVPVSVSPVVYDMAWMNKPIDPVFKRVGTTGKSLLEQLKDTVYREFFPT
jgi:hypothetical protein